MGKFSKDKGARVERFFVNKLIEGGAGARRVPLSGAMANYPGDVIIPWFDGEETEFEAKARADGFKEIYKWLAPAKGLLLKANRKEGLVVLRLTDFMELLNYARLGWEARIASSAACFPSQREAA